MTPVLRFLNPLKRCLFLLAAFLLLSAHSILAVSSKEEILKKYERAVYLTEELSINHEDIQEIMPKIQLAMRALLRNDFEQSDRVLTETLQDLNSIQSRIPERRQKAFQGKWLEIYYDIIQKFAVLALLAFLWIRIPLFKRQLLANRLTSMARIYLVVLAGFASVLFSFFDVALYGQSAWAFMDMQVILVTLGGLTGGFVPGLCLGILGAAFRLILSQQFFQYAGIVLAGGLLGGALSRCVKDSKKIRGWALLAGALAGLVHGAVIYLPLIPMIGGSNAAFSIGFVALLEGLAVFVGGAVISGQLQEENRREMEKEFLNTKLNFLQAQINPHFLYNALNTISAVCGQENAFRAQDLILRLAEFFRATLKRAEDSVTLKEEMAHLEAYLTIEKARFQDRLSIEKKMNISDSAWNTKMPFLILQPLVENAVKHGTSKKTEGGRIEICAEEKDGKLFFEIRDDGAGMSPPALEGIFKNRINPGEGGVGVQNVNHRLQSWTRVKNPLRYESQPGKGTLVKFEIPVKR